MTLPVPAAVLAVLLAAGAAPAAQVAAPLYDAVDVRFMTHMIAHHEQALELAALVPGRSDREVFLRYARYIAGGQGGEIEHMKSLLQAARDRGVEVEEPHFHDDPPMHGMLSRAQMAAIAAARGAEFERLWLEGMIAHHEGALEMARAQQEHQFRTRRSPFGIDAMVDEMLVTQRAEVTQMRDWLREWSPRR